MPDRNPKGSVQLILVARQLSALAYRIAMSPSYTPFTEVHEKLCFDAILAINELLMRRTR